MHHAYLCPWVISCLFRPSKETHADFLLEGAASIWWNQYHHKCGWNIHYMIEYVNILTVSSTPEGTTIERKEREWGQIGVTIIQGTLGWTILAPAAREYAVLPVGVAIMIPGLVCDMSLEWLANNCTCNVYQMQSACTCTNSNITISLNRGHFTPITRNGKISKVWIRPTVYHKIIHNLHQCAHTCTYCN